MADNFSIEIKGLDKLQKGFKKMPTLVKTGLAQAIKTSVNLIRPIMQKEAPFDTGKLQRNITASASGLTGKIGPNLKKTVYALYVHEGTSPYTIRPKTAKALWWPGLSHPVRMVKHPGIKANPFVDRTLRIVEGPVAKVFENKIDSILKQI